MKYPRYTGARGIYRHAGNGQRPAKVYFRYSGETFTGDLRSCRSAVARELVKLRREPLANWRTLFPGSAWIAGGGAAPLFRIELEWRP